VNQDYATAIADKMLGIQADGSEAELGAMQISQLNGCFESDCGPAQRRPRMSASTRELVWVAPLVQTASSAWASNHVTHDYVIVSRD